ncbi:MAG: hypothetical protein A2475_02615 [Ignavibacteria bacterium RIFOXYC2_FULL_35_21]|nr:MAG: hypothetical protein A2220_00130 [Ignavibacteria bacterium RIFOXYA2_FULL_35_10]OGV19329.1 MAG: hypothetical protein A2475_02615 [Ignavibacteria bacterium RIFOXYC2_FULL_35_21]
MVSIFGLFRNSSNHTRDLAGNEELVSLMNEIKCTETIPGAADSFNRLYDATLKPLLSRLRKDFPGIDKDSLKDIFQDGWEKVIRFRRSYRDGQNVFNWIYTIIKNTAIDHIRKKSTYKNKFENFSTQNVYSDDERAKTGNNLLEAIASDDRSIIDKLDLQTVSDAILKAIEEIENDSERKIIKLRIIEEMKYEDISKELNLPLSTINYKLNNALGEIRKKLGKMKL